MQPKSIDRLYRFAVHHEGQRTILKYWFPQQSRQDPEIFVRDCIQVDQLNKLTGKALREAPAASK
jgi:hypothetical protein